jgi:transposase
VIIAEIGLDMSRFADAGHLVSWAGLCPGNNESAGKRFFRPHAERQPLSTPRSDAACLVHHPQEGLLPDIVILACSGGGRTKAAMAVVHRILTITWRIIHEEDAVYRELSGSYHDSLRPQRSARRIVRRLEQLGFEVSVKAKVAAPAPAPESLAQSANMGNAEDVGLG